MHHKKICMSLITNRQTSISVVSVDAFLIESDDIPIMLMTKNTINNVIIRLPPRKVVPADLDEVASVRFVCSEVDIILG